MEGLVLIDEAKGAKSAEKAVERLLKRKRRQVVSTTVEVFSKEAPSVKPSVGPSTEVGARASSKKATSLSMNKIVDLARIGLDGGPGMEAFRALTTLSKALVTNVKRLRIPCSQIKKGCFMGYAPLSQS